MVKGLKERLDAGETVLCAEGYVFEAERRGYLQAGPFVPELVLKHPEVVREMHRDFVHAGSDVVQALTYYGHREKLRHINKENIVEELNIQALKIARKYADETGTLMAGNICNTAVYDNACDDPKLLPKAIEEVKRIFTEQIQWAVQEGADFIVAETYPRFGEALLAVQVSKKIAPNLPIVVTMMPQVEDKTLDGYEYGDACRKLEEAGADVVGFNCVARPLKLVKIMEQIRKVCKGPIAALPVPYRCNEEHMFLRLKLPNGKRAFFDNLDYYSCDQDEVREFGEKCKEIGVQYLGVCCGNSPRYFRALAESIGRKPPASEYSSKMELHYILGKNATQGTAAIREFKD